MSGKKLLTLSVTNGHLDFHLSNLSEKYSALNSKKATFLSLKKMAHFISLNLNLFASVQFSIRSVF